MKIQQKVILIISAIAVLSLLAVWLLRYNENSRTQTIINERTREQSVSLNRNMILMGRNLEDFVYDYTVWDEFVEFTKNRSRKWAYNNIFVSLNTFKSDVALVLNPDFSTIYFTSILDDFTEKDYCFPYEYFKNVIESTKSAGAGYFAHFFIKTKLGVLEVRGAAIHGSSDLKREIAPAGYFFVGRLWTKQYCNELGAANASTVELIPPTTNAAKYVSGKQEVAILNAILLRDYQNRPVARLISYSSIPIVEKTEKEFFYQYLTQLFFWVVILAVVSWFLMKNVRAPLRIISASLRSSDPALLKQYENSRSEVGEFAKIVKQFFHQQEELANAKTKAEETEKFKSSLLLNMNHEFRTPMTGILGLSSLLEQDLQGDPRQMIAQSIYSSGKRLMETLNSILILTDIEANRTIGDMQETELSAFVVAIANEKKPQVEQRGLTFNIQSCGEYYRPVDKELFKVAIERILDNAIKYTEKGGISIEICPQKKDGRYLAAIKIADTGIGIAPEELGRIFQAFHQVSQGVDRQYEGSGLGLTIAKKITEMMGGEIVVESQVGKGSVFTILV
ncbi:MAG: ATP-binding protein [Bacteroidota bacterium]